MQRFDYRAPRYLVDFPVQLAIEDSTFVGRCKEISTEGMRMEISQPGLPEGVGTLTMSFDSLAVEISARVTHAEPNAAGLKFIYNSERQRKAIDRLVTLLAASAQLPGRLLLN